MTGAHRRDLGLVLRRYATGRPDKRAWVYARGYSAETGRVHCCYCDARLALRCNTPAVPYVGRGATIDHVDPAGGNEHTNLVVACHQCNTLKARRTPGEWALSGGPPDAAKRAFVQAVAVPTTRGLEYTRAKYGLILCGGGAGSGAGPQGRVGAWTAPYAVWPVRGGSRAQPWRACSYGPHVQLSDGRSEGLRGARA